MMGMVAGFSAVIGGVMLVFAILYFAVGYGLWKLKNWTRIITIVLSGLGAAFGLLGSLMAFEIISLVIQLVILAIYGWVLWYLFQSHVKEAFDAA